jgi:tetratricopeptide (TPR) repeat protein
MYNELGQAQTARQVLEKTLPKVKSFNELQLTAPHLRQLVWALSTLGLESMAAKLVQELLQVIDQQPHIARHRTMPLLFTCYWFADRSTPQTKASLQRLERIHIQLDNSITAAALSEGRGLVALTEGNSLQAVEQFRQAVTFWQRLNRPYDQARALNGLGQALIQVGESDEAGVTYDQALSLVESLAVQLEDVELKTSFLNSTLIQDIHGTRATVRRTTVDC